MTLLLLLLLGRVFGSSASPSPDVRRLNAIGKSQTRQTTNPCPRLKAATMILSGGSVEPSPSESNELVPIALPPHDGVDWDAFGFSLNGVETEAMFVATTTDTLPGPGKCAEAWAGQGSSCGLRPLGPIAMHPAATVLNYGQGLFEGLKAMRRSDGSIVVFRPEMNARRMAAGARRLCLPPVPEKMFVDAIVATVRANSQWVPPCGKGALYLRPLLFGSGAALGVGPSPEATFVVYASPVGTYFKKDQSPSGHAADHVASPSSEEEKEEGREEEFKVEKKGKDGNDEDDDGGGGGDDRGDGAGGEDGGAVNDAGFTAPPPIRLLVTPRFHRSVEGGVGGVKASGNYAPVFKASLEAKAAGHDEVLFLDGRSDRFVEEAGASNFFAVAASSSPGSPPTLYTPGLGRGSILPGITRDSIVELATDLGFEVVEGDLPVGTVLEASEAFCCGTGATITPVGAVNYRPGLDASETETVRSVKYYGGSSVGPVTRLLASKMFGIHAGTEPDVHGWVSVVMRGPPS
mmetsp:Transcript_24881/g.49768  ORF Transcript_24881/g.49768 Transcript_24881/m.49768 type:complete len:519 (+) Transcript_24881:101-1657(+)